MCGGLPGQSSAGEAREERLGVILQGPATWTRDGRTLTLRRPGHGPVRLHDEGRAPQLVDTTWSAVQYDSSNRGHEVTAPVLFRAESAGRYVVREPGAHACAATGRVRPAKTTAVFTPGPPPSCTLPGQVRIVSTSLRGRLDYEVDGGQLLVSARSGGRFVLFCTGRS